MQVQRALSDGQGLGAVDRELLGPQVSMERNDGFVLEGLRLRANLNTKPGEGNQEMGRQSYERKFSKAVTHLRHL